MLMRTASSVAILLFASGAACTEEKANHQGGAPGSAWADAARMPDLFSGMWATFSPMVESQAKLDVPYTAKAQKFVDAYKFKRDIPYAEEGCATPGLPIAMRTGPIKFTYAPGLITIYMQSVGNTRFIRMNEPMGKTAPKFYGTSVGHWEGDTLVVETQDFLPEISFQYGIGKGLPDDGTSPPIIGPGIALGDIPGGLDPAFAGSLSKAIWGPHGEGMHMVERMRLVDPGTLEIKLTLYDDTVWTKPYVTATRTFMRLQKGIREVGPYSGEPEEWVCTISITSYDPASNTYMDKDPDEVVKYLDKLGR